jgi:hypothetical protein
MSLFIILHLRLYRALPPTIPHIIYLIRLL